MKGKNLYYVFESVLAVVKGYNKILDSLSDEERLLFKPLINVSPYIYHTLLRKVNHSPETQIQSSSGKKQILFFSRCAVLLVPLDAVI